MAGAGSLVAFALSGLGIATAGLLGFYLVQRHGVGALERVFASIVVRLARAASRAPGDASTGLDAGLRAVWRDPHGVAVAAALHLAAWLVGVLEIWIALRCMAHPGGLADAAIIESLGQALRGGAFPIPGALGVQEGGFVLLGRLVELVIGGRQGVLGSDRGAVATAVAAVTAAPQVPLRPRRESGALVAEVERAPGPQHSGLQASTPGTSRGAAVARTAGARSWRSTWSGS